MSRLIGGEKQNHIGNVRRRGDATRVDVGTKLVDSAVWIEPAYAVCCPCRQTIGEGRLRQIAEEMMVGCVLEPIVPVTSAPAL